MRKFIKLFSALALFFLIFTANSFSEIVNKVKIQGNERISLESIMVFGDITLGNNYESQDINLLIKKLYETNFFSDIETQLKDGVLTVTVRENPIVNSIVFNGEKAKKYKEKMRELIVLKEKGSFIENCILRPRSSVPIIDHIKISLE